jgi:hypothetical protein
VGRPYRDIFQEGGVKMSERDLKLASDLEAVINEMVDEGYHYPNDWLVALARVAHELGGRDYIAEWEKRD